MQIAAMNPVALNKEGVSPHQTLQGFETLGGLHEFGYFFWKKLAKPVIRERLQHDHRSVVG
jgi:hypothetical protein